MKIGICEDDKTQKEYLVQEVLAYYEKKHIAIEIETFESAEELLFRYPLSLPFSCLILDIWLDPAKNPFSAGQNHPSSVPLDTTGLFPEKMDGMTLAKKIREKDRDIPIIFITGDRESVFEGYKVGAARYLLKPYKKEDLAEALSCLAKEEPENGQPEEFFCFSYLGDFLKIRKSDILYVQVDGHYISIKTTDGEYRYKESLKNIKKSLADERFAMANRSMLVNLQHVEKITKSECTLSDGTTAEVSRGCCNSLGSAFIHFYHEQGRNPAAAIHFTN